MIKCFKIDNYSMKKFIENDVINIWLKNSIIQWQNQDILRMKINAMWGETKNDARWIEIICDRILEYNLIFHIFDKMFASYT